LRRSQRVRLYFFELFTVANFVVLLIVLRGETVMPLWTIGSVLPSVAVGFLAQTLLGMAIRLAIGFRRGTAQDLLAIYRSDAWLGDTLRLALFSGLWIHTYGWIKLTVPLMHPRLFDAELWNLDRAICFGHSPNVFLLTLFGTPTLLRIIDWTYANVFFASLNIAAIFIGSAPERKRRVAFMNSNTLLWLLGAWLYVAVPALGPAYRFPQIWLPLAPLLGRTQTFQRILIANYRAVLFGAPRAVNILFGVAAFPSLHVGFQTLAFLWMRTMTRWGGAVFIVFVVFIFIGSMVTGWHYLIDGVAGAVLAWGCYEAAKRIPAIRA
jgi:hypothetical protein